MGLAAHHGARGVFLDQGSNPCPLHWQAASYPLCHQGSLHMALRQLPGPELLVAGRVCLGAQGGHHRQDQLLAGAARPPSLPPHPSQGFIFPAHQPRRTPHLHHSLGKELFTPPFANEKTEVQNKYILLDISESEEQGLPPLKPSDP